MSFGMNGLTKYTPEGADKVFNEDGTVRLPRAVGFAISLAVKERGPLTRQPTRDRAQAVLDAVADRLVERGVVGEIRHSERNDTWAVYLKDEQP